MLDKFKRGTLDIGTGAEATAASASLETSAIKGNKNYTLYVLSDGGASATFTLRTLRIKVNKELTDNQQTFYSWAASKVYFPINPDI